MFVWLENFLLTNKQGYAVVVMDFLFAGVSIVNSPNFIISLSINGVFLKAPAPEIMFFHETQLSFSIKKKKKRFPTLWL